MEVIQGKILKAVVPQKLIRSVSSFESRHRGNWTFQGCSCCGAYFCSSKTPKQKFPTSLHQKRSVFSSKENLTSMVEKNNYVEEILSNNRRWVDLTNKEDPDFFKNLGAKKILPKYLYFGCSDARVPVNQILGLDPGEVFVHRNIGNLVPVNDLNALSVLEFAVTHLDIKDIIVAGHYDCGAVRAATSKQDMGMLENWLRLIRDVYRLHNDHLDHIDDEEERHFRLVELNVMEQCINLFKTGVIQRKRNQTKRG